MNLPKYTKAEMRRSHGAPTITDAAVQMLTEHLELSHSRLPDLNVWIAGFIRVVIWENESWPVQEQIESHLKDFLLAIRSGRATIKSNTVLAYADAHREWIYAKSASNFIQNAQESEFRYTHDTIRFEGGTADFRNPSAWRVNESECYSADRTKRTHRNIVDLLEGLERFGNLKTSSEYHAVYKQARRIYEQATGTEWVPYAWEGRNEKGYLNMERGLA